MFYVHYDVGSCNYDDHSTGLEAYGTRDLVDARIKELHTRHGRDVDITLIEGVEIPLSLSPENARVVCTKFFEEAAWHIVERVEKMTLGIQTAMVYGAAPESDAPVIVKRPLADQPMTDPGEATL